MECKKEKNLKNCNCTYEPCSRKGVCCECIEYHKSLNELPACLFSSKAERSFDRSPDAFFKDQKR